MLRRGEDYYRLLFDEKWQLKKWKGPIQYEDKTTKVRLRAQLL
jgi:hypothetical protein